MILGYNTNGLAHHDLLSAIALLGEIGYRSVAITLDHAALPPGAADGPERLDRVRRRLEELQMRSVIETGARFLLDPRAKHEPTLISPDAAGRARRLDFYRYAVDCAAALGSDCVSLWSGVLQAGIAREEALRWLVAGLQDTLDYAAARGVTIAFEPEPGMLVDSMESFAALRSQLEGKRGQAPFVRSTLRAVPANGACPLFPGVPHGHLGLTLDVGHLQCQGEVPLAETIARWAPLTANVHLEDMRRGVHQHLMFGEGEIDFPPVLRAFAAAGYRGGIHVELSRHSHEGPTAARRAFEFLSGITPA